MSRSRVESVGSLYQQQITKFPILKHIQSQVETLHKIEAGKLNIQYNDQWYSGNEHQQKPNELKQLIERTISSVQLLNPALLDLFKGLVNQLQQTITFSETVHVQILTDYCTNSLTSTLRFVQKLLVDKGVKFPNQEQKQEIQSEIYRRQSFVSVKQNTHNQHRRISDLQLENCKLALEVQQLSQKLKFLEQTSDVEKLKQHLDNLQQESENEINRLSQEKEALDKQIIKDKQLIAQMKAVIQKLEQQINSLKLYIDQNENRFRTMENNFNQINSERAYWREVALMEKEDLDAYTVRFMQYVKEEANARKKLMMLQKKIDKMKIERSKQMEIPEKNKEADEQLAKLTYMFTQDKFHITYMRDIAFRKFSKLHEQEQINMGYLKNMKYDYKIQDVLHKYCYARSSFLIFYENQMRFIENEFRNIEHHKISLMYFATIRAILDSKQNEMLYIDDIKTSSKFPDFVFSWISTFTVDKITRQITTFNEKNQTLLDNIRLDFLLDLLNPKLAHINECITFNELIFEQSSQDEVYYYLHCRSLIFQGQIQNHSRYSFETIMYVTLSHAEKVIEMIMNKYDNNNILQVKNVIKDQATTKAKKTLIDAHYVLRILLELYRQERRNRLNMLKEMFHNCQQLQSNGKYGVNYRNFRKIFQFNFPETTELEVCTLFRESHMCGDGQVTAESFFTAATESCFFIKQLLLKTFHQAPQMENYQIQYSEQNMPFLSFFNQFKQIPQKYFNLPITKGLEQVDHDLKTIQQLVKDQFQDQYNTSSLLQTSYKLISIFCRLRNLDLSQRTFEITDIDQDAINSTLQFLPTIYKPLLDLEDKQKFENLKKAQFLRMFQKMAKRKMQKFYSLLSAMLTTKIGNPVSTDNSPKRKFQRQSSMRQVQ